VHSSISTCTHGRVPVHALDFEDWLRTATFFRRIWTSSCVSSSSLKSTFFRRPLLSLLLVPAASQGNSPMHMSGLWLLHFQPREVSGTEYVLCISVYRGSLRFAPHPNLQTAPSCLASNERSEVWSYYRSCSGNERNDQVQRTGVSTCRYASPEHISFEELLIAGPPDFHAFIH
jgi:hypothetical protein